MLFNVAAGTKMGREGAMNAEDWARVRYYRRRMFDADRPMEKQTVIDEFWDEWESNLGEPGLAKYKGFRDKWYWAQGHSMLSGQRRAYYGEMVNGTPHEVSRTSSARAKARAQEARDEAQAQLTRLSGTPTPPSRGRRTPPWTTPRSSTPR